MSVEGNSYSYTRVTIAKNFGVHIEGSLSAFFLVVAEKELRDIVREALEKSAHALGWSEGASYVWIQNKDDRTLSQAELFEIIEGLDPLCIVLVGKAPRELAAAAFRCDIPKLGRFRLFGREACAFDNLDSLLTSDTGKQTVWSLLRALPRASSQ